MLRDLEADGAETDDAHALAAASVRTRRRSRARPAPSGARPGARSAAGSWRASAIVTPSTCSAIDAGADAARAGQHDRAREQFGKHRLPTPTAGLCTHRSRVSDAKRSRSTNGVNAASASGSSRRSVVAIPGVEERVLRKVARGAGRRTAAAAPTPARG